MASEPSKAIGWLKTFLGTVAGLFSGAFVMYLTPLVDRVVKPARPMANFAVDYDDLTVTFHNRSAAGADGWWDFGDGSPLEPLVSRQETVLHTYVTPGDYTAKLILRNLIGEESERTVTLHLDTPYTEPPTILAVDATPVSQGAYAPATFRVTGKAKNARLCIWDIGDDRPLEISTDKPNEQQRLVTFAKPGGYLIKMAAVNGTQAVEHSEIVYVNEPPAGTVAAILTVTDQGTRVETLMTPYVFHDTFPPYSKDNDYHLFHQVPARAGYEITDIRLTSANGTGLQGRSEIAIAPSAVGVEGVKDLRLQLGSDRRSARLTGELVRESGPGKRAIAPPSLVVPVVLVQERRSPASRPAIPVTATLTAPGSALLSLPPLPEDWIDPQRQMQLELQDGDRRLWQGTQLPYKKPVTINNRSYHMSARLVGNTMRVDLAEIKPGSSPAAN